MSPYIDTSVLLQTRNTARALARLVSPRLQPNADKELDVLPSSTLALTLPAPLTHQLLAQGFDDSSAGRISAAVADVTLRLKNQCEVDFQQRREALRPTLHQYQDPKLSFLVRAYVAIFSRTCHNWSSYVLEDFAPRFLKAQALYKERCSQSPWSRRRRSFNQAAVPALEQFFEENAFPSRLEKEELASRCDMEFRQIHVWFQNRRSRFRKEGKELKKPHSSVLAEEMENSIIDVLLPLDASEELDIQDTSQDVHDTTFNLQSPAHAFPSPYPPLCAYNPFPKTCAFETHWPRTRGSSQSSPRADIQLHDLVASFANLSLTKGHSDLPCSSLEDRCGTLRGCSAQDRLPYVVICTRAPHPALVRRPRLCRSHLHPSLPLSHSVASDTARGHSSRGDPTTPLANTSSLGSPTFRTRRRLPRRFPKHPFPLPPTPKAITSPSFDLSPILPSRNASRASSVSSLSSEGSIRTEPLLSTPPPLSPLSRPRAVSPLPMIGQGLHTNYLLTDDFADFATLNNVRSGVTFADVKGPTSIDSFDPFCDTDILGQFLQRLPS